MRAFYDLQDPDEYRRIARSLRRVAEMENTPIPGVGSFSMLTDPTGAMFALFQPAPGPC